MTDFADTEPVMLAHLFKQKSVAKCDIFLQSLQLLQIASITTSVTIVKTTSILSQFVYYATLFKNLLIYFL